MTAKKKNINSEKLISWYMEYVTEKERIPKSIGTFAKASNFEEQLFYKHYTNFTELDQDIYKSFFDQTVVLLKQMDDYNNFSARNKLLSFYYTLFELLTLNRSFIIINLKSYKGNLARLKPLKRLHKSIKYFIYTLRVEMLNLNLEVLNNLQSKILEEAAWLQFLFVFNFWFEDESPEFEKTDILIEKSINTTFDLINIQPIKSALDLGKFLLNEKIKK
ncbi:MAG: TetR/AcrR family transcriptional regulator [Flavobacteriaceae bacterium]|nr:TetR/AcrR family transcriptional regulator [Flavobacteriaceae bacterium]